MSTIQKREWAQPAEVNGFKPSTMSVVHDLQEARRLARFRFGTGRAEVRQTEHSLWIVLPMQAGGSLALQGLYVRDGRLRIEGEFKGDGHHFEVMAEGNTMGRFRGELDIMGDVLRWRAWLTPHEDLLIPLLPLNLFPLDAHGDPRTTVGTVHAAQRGCAAGVLFFSVWKPAMGSVMYLQNLTALNEYCQATDTTPDTIVGEEWPSLGFHLPPAREKPLPAGHEFSICDCFIRLSPTSPRDDRESARMFIDLLGDIYCAMPRPQPAVHDWPQRARDTVRDLEHSSKVKLEQQGYVFLHPYVAAEYPDSMVQLAVLLPLCEYAAWSGERSPMIEQLRAGVKQFYDPKLRCMRRYLATVGDDKDPLEVDSWYMYHPMMNLARLAMGGDAEARELFLACAERGIETAHHFDYCWPIKFKIDTFEVTQAKAKPGGRGQTDVPGLYAYVMVQAHQLTGKQRYLQEAEKALRSLAGLGFGIGYQFNNTAWGAMACLHLCRLTGNTYWRDQSYVFLASFFHNCVLWECRLGPAQHYPTFMGVMCLHDGAYMAMYEEFESVMAFMECFEHQVADLSPNLRLLMAEYCRYALDRCWYYYPIELPREALATEFRNGHVDRSLIMPLEDLYIDNHPAGHVGQEIYGCGAPFAFASRFWRKLEGVPFILYCDIPLGEIRLEDEGLRFHIHGDPRCECRVRLLPLDDDGRLPAHVSLGPAGKRTRVEPRVSDQNCVEFILHGGSEWLLRLTD